MKILYLMVLGLLLAAMPLAAAQEERALELNMTLEGAPVEPCVLAGSCAIGHVYVNVTEPPPQPGITGFFAFEPLDIDLEAMFSKAVSKIKDIFNAMFCSC